VVVVVKRERGSRREKVKREKEREI